MTNEEIFDNLVWEGARKLVTNWSGLIRNAQRTQSSGGPGLGSMLPWYLRVAMTPITNTLVLSVVVVGNHSLHTLQNACTRILCITSG